MKYKSKVVEIDAWGPWEGGGYKWLVDILGFHFGRANAHEVAWEHPDEEEAVVYNVLERSWVPLPIGHYLIRGLKGEFYTCDPEIFLAKYEAVEPISDMPEEK